jgi:hypothetical protein
LTLTEEFEVFSFQCSATKIGAASRLNTEH